MLESWILQVKQYLQATQVSLESVYNFLCYSAHRQTERQTDRQTKNEKFNDVSLWHLLWKSLLWSWWSSWAECPPASRSSSASTFTFNSSTLQLLADTVLLHFVDCCTAANVESATVCFTDTCLCDVFTGSQHRSDLIPLLTVTARLVDTSSNTFINVRFFVSAAEAFVRMVSTTATCFDTPTRLSFSLSAANLSLILESQRDFGSEVSRCSTELAGFRTLRCFVAAGRLHRCSHISKTGYLSWNGS